MNTNVQYRSEQFLQPNQSFHIIRAKEHDAQHCIYHSHDFVEICYVYAGSGFHVVDGVQYEVYKGDLFIINYDVSHAFISRKNEQLYTYNVIIKPDFIKNELSLLYDFSPATYACLFEISLESGEVRIKKTVHFSVAQQQKIEALFLSMLTERLNRQEGFMNMLKAYTIELFVMILRSFGSPWPSEHAPENKVNTVQSIIDYLNQNYSQKFKLENLAMNCFVSKNYLCRLFKETTGITITEYLQGIRIEHACTMLRDRTKNLMDVAAECGFHDYKFFVATFKKIKGLSPKAFRESTQ